MQLFLHYFLHFGLPLILAKYFFNDNWKRIYIIFMATMIVDLDHLLANPIFNSERCSINFHPLHSFYAIIIYFLLLFLSKPYNLIGLGLILHMFADFVDCLFIIRTCENCVINNELLKILRLF